MNCKNCNAPIPPGNRFCAHCGAPADQMPAQQQNYQQPQQNYQQQGYRQMPQQNYQQMPQQYYQQQGNNVPAGGAAPAKKPTALIVIVSIAAVIAAILLIVVISVVAIKSPAEKLDGVWVGYIDFSDYFRSEIADDPYFEDFLAYTDVNKINGEMEYQFIFNKDGSCSINLSEESYDAVIASVVDFLESGIINYVRTEHYNDFF